MLDVILNIVTTIGMPAAFFILLVILLVVMAVKLYGRDFIPLIVHRRNRFRSLLWCVFAVLMIFIIGFERFICKNQIKWNGIFWVLQIIGIALFVLYSIEMVFEWKHYTPLAERYLKNMEKLIDRGSLLEIQKQIEKMPCYFIRKSDLNGYYLLCMKYYAKLNQPGKVIKISAKVLQEILYEDKLEEYIFRTTIAYVQMEAYEKAETSLSRLEKKDKNKDYEYKAEYWNLKCFIEDMKGNLEQEELYIRKGLSVAKEDEYFVKAQLNNNYARIYSLKGDQQNMLYYMKWAKRQIRQAMTGKNQLKHMTLASTVYGNLILGLVRKDPEDSQIEDLREEYWSLVKITDNVESYINYQNLLLEMFRQSGINNYYHIVIQGYQKMVERLIKKDGDNISQERVANEVSTLRILVNGNFYLTVVAGDIHKHFHKYKTLDKKVMLFVYKEMYGLIEQMHPESQREFEKEFQEIRKYYQTDALRELEEIIEELEEYDVAGYIYWMRQKLEILRVIHGRECYPYQLEVHKALILKCHNEAVYKEELRERMLWLDDMTSVENWEPNEKKPKYVLENRKFVDETAELYKKYRRFPEIYEFAILLSEIYFILDDMEKSKDMLIDFIQLKVDIHSYAAWLRLKYYTLLKIHKFGNLIDQEDFQRVSAIGRGSVLAKDMRLKQ